MGIGANTLKRLQLQQVGASDEYHKISFGVEETQDKADKYINNQEKLQKKLDDKNDFKLANMAGLTGHIMSPSLNKSNISGNNGWLSYQKPFVTIVNRRPVGTEDLNDYVGLPIEVKATIGNLSGYTEISDIFFPQNSNEGMTKIEEEEIKALLSSGVIL